MTSPLGKLITPETVRSCTPEIISYTNLRHLVPFLYAAKLLTDDEFAELLNEKQREHERRLRLLAILKTKGPDWPQQFAICLEKASDHKGHAYILEVLVQHGTRDESKTLRSTKGFGRSTSRSESDDNKEAAAADETLQDPGSQSVCTTADYVSEAQLPTQRSRMRRDITSLERVEELPFPGVHQSSAAGVLFVSMDYRPALKPKEPSVDVEMLQKEVRELQQKQIQLGKDHKQLASGIQQEFQELKEFLAQKITLVTTQPQCQHCDVLKKLEKCESLEQQLTEKNRSLKEKVQMLQRRNSGIKHEEVELQNRLKEGKAVAFNWRPNLRYKLAGGSLRLHLSSDKTRVYACGGVATGNDWPNQFVNVFCLHRRRWQKPYPTAVVSYGSAIVNGKLALIGGQKANDLSEFATSVSLLNEEAAPALDAWYVDDNEVPPTLTKRWAPAVVICNEKLIVAGGYDVNDSTLDLVEVLDLTDKQWVRVASLPLCLGAAACISVGGHVYILGGYNSAKRSWLRTVYRWQADQLTENNTSPEGKPEPIETWVEIESMPFAGAAALTFGEHVMTVGGVNEARELSDTIFLFTDEGTWKDIGSIPQARYSCASVILPNSQLMVVGGQTSNTDLLADHVEISTLDLARLGY